VAVNLENPKTIGGEPVVVVAVKNDGVGGRDASAAEELLELLLADDVAAELVLGLRLPVEADGAGDMAGLIGLGVDIDLDEFDAGLAQVSFTQSVETRTSGCT
jgi:hypothetical protein